MKKIVPVLWFALGVLFAGWATGPAAQGTVEDPPPLPLEPEVVQLPPQLDGLPVDMWCHCHKDPNDVRRADATLEGAMIPRPGRSLLPLPRPSGEGHWPRGLPVGFLRLGAHRPVAHHERFTSGGQP